ncbi:nucleotidyl transferase AbiEii/AbiGii toxin family protein [Sphingobacterium oryzagri]
MESSVFASFRLVGGTALSLQLGHRLSVDIDLFSDAPI